MLPRSLRCEVTPIPGIWNGLIADIISLSFVESVEGPFVEGTVDACEIGDFFSVCVGGVVDVEWWMKCCFH